MNAYMLRLSSAEPKLLLRDITAVDDPKCVYSPRTRNQRDNG